jgi:hypothetical protein
MKTLNELETSISELNVSKDFIEQAQKLGISSLKDVMQADFNSIKQHKDFSYIWYGDLLTLLKKKELLHQFQEKQL